MSVFPVSARERKASFDPPCCPPSLDPLTPEQVRTWVTRAESLAEALPGLSWRYLLLREGLTGARADQVVDVLEGRAEC